MRQLLQMFLFDMKMTFKNFMGAYMIIVPMIILIVLRLFIPTVESSTVTFAVVTEGPNAVDREMIESLEGFGEIIPYATIEEMENKLRGIGTVEGLYRDSETGQYVSVLERATESNNIFSFAARTISERNTLRLRELPISNTAYLPSFPKERKLRP